MPELNVITKGMEGVRMRSDPLFVEDSAFSFARNMSFSEGNIETRPSIDYLSLGAKGQFQGVEWFSPDRGISSQSYSMSPTAIAVASDGGMTFTPTNCGELGKSFTIDICPTVGDVNFVDAENHLIILDGKTAQWWSGGKKSEKSKGFKECEDISEKSHDTFLKENHENFIPHQAYMGVYTDGRVLVAAKTKSQSCLGKETSAIWVSDPLGKRGCVCHSGDILLMEEQIRPSYGPPLVHPSRMGCTVAMAVIPKGGDNGDDFTVDFAQDGASFHTVLVDGREARADAEGKEIRKGWDEKKLSDHGVLQSISASSRYSHHDLPKDILFQSQYGLHFLKTSLGEGSFNDETTNHLSHDIEPLMEIDESRCGNSVGHWVAGNRFFTSLGLRGDSKYTSSRAARGFGSINQAARFTRDRTPVMEWEGLWEPDEGIWGIHRFLRGGDRKTSKEYGMVVSDNDTNILYGKFSKESRGYDTRDGGDIAIDWEVWTKAHVISGLSVIDEIRDGQISIEVDETTEFVAIDIWSDRCQEWNEWKRLTCSETGKTLMTKSFGKPDEANRKGSWFQFRVRGEGWANIRRMTVDFAENVKEQDQPDNCVSLKEEEQTYFRSVILD